MASLTELPNLVGFFSYSRNDDGGDDGAVAGLANRIYRELRSQLGRTDKNFKLWRDKDALAAGEHWKEKLKEAVSESVFFIQMVTPSAVNSNFCRFEFESFIERERELARSDLVFPILYISVPDLESTTMADPVISVVKDRQYVDWRPIRHQDVNSPEVKRTVEQFCAVIARKLRAPWLSPEEQRAIAEQKRIEEEQRRQAEEAKRKTQEEERRKIAESQRQVEEERSRKEAERLEQRRREEQERSERERQAREKEEQRRAEAKRQTEIEQKGRDGEQQTRQPFIREEGLAEGEAAQGAATPIWQLLLLPWETVETIIQARFLLVTGAICFAAMALICALAPILPYEIYDVPVAGDFYSISWRLFGASSNVWIPLGLAVFFGSCAALTYLKSSRAATYVGSGSLVFSLSHEVTNLIEGYGNIIILLAFFSAAVLTAIAGIRGVLFIGRFEESSKETSILTPHSIQKFLGMSSETARQSMGRLLILQASIRIIWSCFLWFTFRSSGLYSNDFISFVGWTILAAASIWIGYGLIARKEWVRTWGIVVSIIGWVADAAFFFLFGIRSLDWATALVSAACLTVYIVALVYLLE